LCLIETQQITKFSFSRTMFVSCFLKLYSLPHTFVRFMCNINPTSQTIHHHHVNATLISIYYFICRRGQSFCHRGQGQGRGRADGEKGGRLEGVQGGCHGKRASAVIVSYIYDIFETSTTFFKHLPTTFLKHLRHF
jgi:hypothetical protein